MSRAITVAIEGNPNVGKSTLFNALTGLRQHVANWPGKTVEKREGLREFEGRLLKIVDLPGIYSLTAYSVEEVIARDFIMQDKPDVVVNIVDASSLERNLYLTSQILELTDKVVVALNMVDVLEARGVSIDVKRLSETLGVPVVPVVATKGRGIEELLLKVVEVAERKIRTRPLKIVFGPEIEEKIKAVEEVLRSAGLRGHPLRWLAIRLLENDPEAVRIVTSLNGGQTILRRVDEVRGAETARDLEMEIADRRYSIVDEIVRSVLGGQEILRSDISDKIDRIVTHRIFGFPILLGIYAGVFWLTFHVSAPLSDMMDGFFVWLGAAAGSWLSSIKAPHWLVSLVVDGVIPGVGGVLVFLPLIAVFFLIFSFLEDLGYFSRAAFIMDRIMRAVGLHGKAFFSLFMGYSCNVAGIMATRMLESRKDRLIAALVNPLIPCSARLGVMSFLAAVFFAGDAATLVMLSLVVLSLVLVALVGLLLQKLVLPSENTYFIMEMPPYRIPTIRGLAIHMYERVGIFVKRAGTFIFLVSIIIWALSSFPEAVELSETYIGQAGRMLEPIGALLGFDWRLMVALIFGFAAKELTLSTLSILYGLEEEAELGIILAASWTPLTAFTFLTVQMIYVPCLATVAVMRKETNSWGWTALGVAYTLALAFVVGLIVYHGGLLIFGGG